MNTDDIDHAKDFCLTVAEQGQKQYVEQSATLPCPLDFESAVANDGAGNDLGLCFKNLGKLGVSWDYCNARCKSLGVNASLPVMHHWQEWRFSARFAQLTRADFFWIGL